MAGAELTTATLIPAGAGKESPLADTPGVAELMVRVDGAETEPVGLTSIM